MTHEDTPARTYKRCRDLATKLRDMADVMRSEDHAYHGHAGGEGASDEEVALRLAADVVDEMKAIDVALELLGDESVDARNEGEAAVCRGIAHALREIAKARGDLDEAPAHFRERECKACGATIADGPDGLEVL